MRKVLLLIFLFISFVGFSQTPGGVSGSRLWLRADVGTNTTTDGGGITSWSDQSGNAFNATGTGLAVYDSSNLLNYNPVISFTDDPQPITGAINRPVGTASTMFVVGSVSQISTRKSIVEFGQGGNDRQMFFNNTYSIGMSYTLDVNTRNIWTISDAGAKLAANITENGLEIGSVVTKSGSFNTSWTNGNYYLGDDDTGGDRLTGEIAEVIYYDSQLSDTESRKVETYLAVKYGITLSTTGGGAHGDYVLSDDSLVWDASSNVTYHHEVIGIGRDDDSSFEQIKSTESSGILTLDKTGSFSTDLGYIIVGNDANSLEVDSGNTPVGIINKSQRTWKVATHGSPGTISVSFELGGDIPNTGIASDYEMIIDGDTDFTDAPTHSTGANIVGNILTFTNVSFSDGDYFTLGLSSISFSPGSVNTGIVSWFKADAGTSTTVDGAAITTWSNNVASTHATQAGSSDFPTYQENIHNNNPSVYFASGDNGYFDLDLDAINSTDYNIIAIVERDHTEVDNYFIGTTSTTDNQGLHLGYTSNSSLSLNQYNNDVNVAVNNYDHPAVSTALIRGELNNSVGKTIQQLRDGVLVENTDAVTTFLTGTQPGVLGRGFDSNGFRGYVSEVIIYNSTLSAANLTKIYSYLAIKYGMTLDSTDGITNGDYQDSDAHVIWDASSNATYHHEVIGIGEDEKSDLEQKKSIEPSSSSIALTIEKTTDFTTDQDFILIGNDQGTIGTTTSGIHPSYLNRVTRTWKAQVSGTPGAIDVSFTIGGAITNTGNTYDYALLVDNDTDFSDASIQSGDVSINGNVVTLSNVSISDGDIFTLAIGLNADAPGKVFTNLSLWLKADAGTNTTTDESGITSWTDQSINGANATGTGSATYESSDLINYNPTISFTNDGHPISGDITKVNGAGSTVFVIGNVQNVTGRETIVEFAEEPYQGNERQIFFTDQYSTNVNTGISKGVTNLWRIQDTDGTSSVSIYENNSLSGSGNLTSYNTVFTTGKYYLGDDATGGDELTGEISEVLYYDTVLSATEVQKVESYLAVKYGITLDNSGGGTDGDYQDSNGNIIWDASANSDYHQQIAIIGLDEDSDLNQKQSKSESANSILTLALGNSVAASNSANANSFTSDLDFLAVGSKSASDVFAIECGETIYKVNRDWKVQKTGFSGTETITLEFDMTGISIPEDFDLLIDTDGDFTTTGDQTTNTGGSLSGNDLTFSAIDIDDLSTGAVFTLIRKASYDLVYDGSWSGDAPDTSDGDNRVVIQSNLTIGASFACDCLKIDSGVVLTIGDTDYVDTDELILNGDLYLEGDAELIQVESTDLNSGTGQVYKIINDATSSGYRFNYLTSPVNTSGTYSLSGNLKFNTGANLGINTDPSFIDNDSDGFGTTISSAWLYTLNSSGTYTKIDEDTDLDPGVGFTMKGTNQANDYNFIGSPNNGDIDALTLVTDEYAIVGNPYPSAIDADTFNTTMLASNITDGVVYLWDQPTGDSHYQDQYDGGYATRIAGLGAPAAGVTGASTPTNIIKPGQGFTIAGGTSGGTVTFTNAMRLSNTSSSGSQFYKTTKQTALKPIIRLGFEFDSEKGRYHRQLVTTPSGGTLGHDNGQDAPMFDGYKNDAYWLVKDQEERYVITTVPVVSEDLQLDLGVVLEEEKEVTFTLDEAELFSNDIYLLDKELNNITDIRATDYTTQVSQGTNTDRFSLVFKEDATLNTELIDIEDKFIIYVEENYINIIIEDKAVKQVRLYDLSGRKLIDDMDVINSSHLRIKIGEITGQFMVLNMFTNQGIVTKKIYL